MSFGKHLRSFSTSKDSVSSAGSFGSFNSSTSSICRLGSMVGTEEDFKENKTCHICSRKFTLTMRRHHCRDCKESVCDEHSVIRYIRETKSKKLRICDKCDKKLIKEELQENILNEINSIKLQIELASEANSRLYNEKFDRTSRIHNLEMRIAQAEKEAKRKEEDLENRLKEEIDSNSKAKARIDDYLKRLEEMKSTESELSEKILAESSKLLNLKAEKINLDTNKARLEQQELDLNQKVKDLVALDTLKQAVCSDCKPKLQSLERPRMSVNK